MTNFLIRYAKKNMEKLIDGALKELRYICCFTSIVKEFEEEKVWLEAETTVVGQHIQVAKRIGEDVQASALFWEEEADKLIQEDTKTKQKCFFGLCPHCIWRYKRGKELTNKKDQIKKLMETGKELAIGLPAPLPDVERYSSQRYISFKSRESEYKELLDALKDDNNYIIGLQGIGGTGKTTLAKEVGKKLKESKQFTCIIVSTVSFSPDIKKIQDDIAGPLGLNFDACSESDRPKTLWRRLTNGEKILLILDDVWGDIDFEEIGIPYSDNHKGCRVLVTTRNVEVCNRLGCDKTITLELLSPDDAWEMFKRHAGLTETSTKSLLDKGRKIVDECEGLPIAIAVIANSLKGEKHQKAWDMTLKSLQNHVSMHGDDDELAIIYECLKLTYDYLNDEKPKRLFLLCSIFREDEEIPVERLTRLSIGAGLFGGNYGSYNDARNEVVLSKKILLNSCLLLEVDEETVKMNGMVRGAAQWIANKEIQTIKLYDKNQKAIVEREKNVKYLSWEGKLKDVLSCKFDSSNLKILIVISQMDDGDCHEVPNSFFENIRDLRVFHLFHTFYQATVSLPQSIQLLKNIRSLLFNNVDLGDISILGNLQSLETLDFDWCKIRKFPEEFANRLNLRLLKLRSCEIILSNPFKVIEGCSSLQELYFIDSFNNCCREISLPKLQRFVLHDGGIAMDGSLSKCVSLLHQKDKHVLSKKQLKDCIQAVEVLGLRGIWWEWVNIIPEIVPMDRGMNDLLELKLSCISQLKCLIDTTEGKYQEKAVFSELVVLELEEMESLEELCNGTLPLNSLKSLEILTVTKCNKLQSLFTCYIKLFNLKWLSLIECPILIFSLFRLTTSRSLVSLEKLVIVGCRHLEYIIDESKEKESRGEIVFEDDDNGSKRSQDSIFPKLSYLDIRECPGLKFIFPFLSIHDLPTLESFSISGCKKLQYIFGYDVQLGSPKQMDTKFNTSPKCDVTTSSPISRDASKSGQQSDPMKCSIFSWTCCLGKNYRHKSMTTARTKIPLVSEDQQQIVIDTGDHRNGGNNWHNVFPKLKEVKVEDCMKLEYIFGHYSDAHQNHNEIHLQLPALERLHIKDLPSLVAMCPQHYRTTFPVLEDLVVDKCSNFAIKSIDDLKIPLVSGSLDTTIKKELNKDHFFALKSLKLYNCKVENIYFLNEVPEEQIILGLKYIHLYNLPTTKCLLVGPKNSFSLNYLIRINILRCEKLKFVFSTSILRCLPQLRILRIEECTELKHIIKDDLKNEKSISVESTNTYFPKLEILGIVNCNKLKCGFMSSVCKELPSLKVLIIREASELQEIFKSEGDDQKFEIPNLKIVAFINLPSIGFTQGMHFEAVRYRLVENCHQLSLTSTSKFKDNITGFLKDYEFYEELLEIVFPSLRNVYEGPPSQEITRKSDIGVEAKTSPKHILTSPQVLIKEQSMDKKHSLGETVTALKPQLDGSTIPEKTLEANSSTILETMKEPPIESVAPKQKEYGHFQIPTMKTNDEVAEASMKVSSNIEEQVPKDDKIIASESKSSPTITSPKESQFPKDDKIIASESKPSPTITSPKESQFPKDDKIIASESKPSPTITSPKESQFPKDDKIIASESKPSPTITSPKESQFPKDDKIIASESKPSPTITSPKESQFPKDDKIIASESKPSPTITSPKESQFPKDDKIIASESKPSPTITSPKESQFPKDDKIIASESKPSPTITSPKASQFPKDDKIIASESKPSPTITSPKESQFPKDDKIIASESKPSPTITSPKASQFPKDDKIIASETKSSPTITSPKTSQFPSLSFKGDLSQIIEDLNSPLFVTRELEQLVSKKHLDYETSSLLTDFLVKHPSLLLKNTSLSNRYKGYAYNCLAELLKFLQTHNVLDVLGSNHSEFVELLQDVRKWGFDKDWLDGIERRTLFSDIRLSQDTLQKLLDSKQEAVPNEVEVLRLKTTVLSQYAEDLKHQLTDLKHRLTLSEDVLESIIHQKTVLSAPIGY